MIRQAISKLVEALQKPGLLGVTGMRRQRTCQCDLAAYFRLVASKLPLEDLGKLADADNKETAVHAAEMTISRTLRLCQPALLEALAVNLLLAYQEGWDKFQIVEVAGLKEADDPTVTTSVNPMDQLGPSGQRAADYAATHAGDLITGINQTTLDLLKDTVAEGIEERLGVDGLARRLRNEVMDMSRKRAATIATTEMNNAFSTAAIEKMQSIDIKYKKWIPVSDPCPICEENAADGTIPVDDSFSSGDDAPPAHPNCRCAVVGARAPKGDE